MATSLHSLPNELLIEIVSHINDNKTLCAFALTSSRYLPFAEAKLYSNILLRESSVARDLQQAVFHRQGRGEHIKSLNLSFDYNRHWQGTGSTLKRVIKQFCNLKDLTVEAPTCNFGRWRGLNHFWEADEKAILDGIRELPSKRLTSLTLHLHGDQQRYWDPSKSLRTPDYGWGDVMALPSLERLEVSCACINDQIVSGARKSSNLKELVLVECSITMEGLQKMLAAPKALEILRLGENAYHTGQGLFLARGEKYNSLFNDSPVAFMKVLSQQRHSLRKFAYIAAGPLSSSKNVTQTCEEFVSLQEIQLSAYVSNHYRAHIITNAPQLERMVLELTVVDVFAPIMHLEEELGVGAGKLDDDTVKKRLIGNVSKALFKDLPETSLASLKELHIVMPPGPIPIRESRKTWIMMLADYWTKHGVLLTLSHKQRGSVHPPILYDETNAAPRNVLLFSTPTGFTDAVNAPDPFGFNDAFQMEDFAELYDQDVLANFDFDSFLAGLEGETDGFDVGDLDL